MEDLSEYLKRTYCKLYKQKPETFETVQDRLVKMNQHRKVNRHDEVFGKRKIPANLSPYLSPKTPRVQPKKEKSPQKKSAATVPPATNKRLEMLAKWKVEKATRQAAIKKTEKPLFKVSHIPINVGLPNLENVNKEIKGKRFQSKFAPPNHQFKPPANVKAIHFHNSNNLITREKKKAEPTITAHRMTTRSQSKNVPVTNNVKKTDRKKASPNKNTKVAHNKTAKNKTTKAPKEEKKEDQEAANSNNKPTDVRSEETLTPNTSILSPDFPIENHSNDDIATPKQITKPPVYVSPFVTISRGKDSARKEYKARKSRTSFSTPKTDAADCTSPKAGARYFTWLVDTQALRLQELRDEWNKYKAEETPPEEAVSMIDVTIGQTSLLLTKKFIQFRGLITQCENRTGEMPVTCEDLHGFWDMMHMQVVNLDKRFDNLANLRANNWEEILPVVQEQVVKKKTKPRKNAKASAGLRAAIEAARRKKLGKSEDQNENAVVEDKTPKNRRRSSRLVVVKTEEKKNKDISPGLMMMKVAQYAKSVETSAKSILKSDVTKSAKSLSKTVLFQDEIEAIDNIENDLNKPNVRSKGQTPTRRSTRSTKKLF